MELALAVSGMSAKRNMISTNDNARVASEVRCPLGSGPLKCTFAASKWHRFRSPIIIWIVIGGLIGWAASIVMKTDAQQGMVLNVVVGIVGALVGGWLLSPLFGTGTTNQNDFSLASLVVSLLGAIILLAVVNLLRRGAPR